MEGKKRYYKNGDPEAYNDFTEHQFNSFSERDKAMWTPFNEHEQSPIPQDVIDFTKNNNLESCDTKRCKELEAEIVALKKENDSLREAMKADVAEEFKDTSPPEPTDEEAEKELIKARLTELGVQFRANTGLKKLKDKLELAEDANNRK